MYEIRELSGQVYVDTYATKKSEVAPAETAVVGVASGPRAAAGNGADDRSDAATGNGHGGNGHGPDRPAGSHADSLAG